MIGEPPSDTGGSHEAKTKPSPPLADVIVGADGATAACAGAARPTVAMATAAVRIRRGLITLSGHAESVSHNMSLNNEIVWTSIPSADFNTTGRRLMGIKSGYSVVRIGRDELDFLFTGNVMASVANVFHDSVLPIIMGNIEEVLAAQINNELPPVVNDLF